MKPLFNLDNPFMQALARIGDLMMLSVLTLVLCLPVVTFGPAVAALFKTVYALTLDTCGAVIPTYLKAFRENFKQAFIVGAALLAALAAFACDFVRFYNICKRVRIVFFDYVLYRADLTLAHYAGKHLVLGFCVRSDSCGHCNAAAQGFADFSGDLVRLVGNNIEYDG